MSAPEITVAIDNLSRDFGPVKAVREISLELRRSEILGLLGPNGAGKTTTLQMLTGNLSPTTGSISICSVDLLEEPTRAKSALGYLPETPPLYRELTVDQYLDLAAKLHRVPKGARKAAIETIKERCGLSGVGPRLIANLSKGYQQRLGIAQAIVHSPDVVILDEPTVGLDPNQIREIRDLIRELKGKHSVILSSHILPEVESICDRVCILHQGRVVFNEGIDRLADSKQEKTLVVGLRNPPTGDEISSIPGVLKATHNGEFIHLNYFDLDPTDELVRRAAGHNWGLYRLAQASASLEEVFVQLTREASGDNSMLDQRSPIPDSPTA